MYSLSNGMYSWPLHVQPASCYVAMLNAVWAVATYHPLGTASYAQYIGSGYLPSIGTGMSQLAKGPGMSTPYLI